MRFRLHTLLIALALGPPLVFAEPPDAKFADALVGEWEIVEMIYKGKVQDFRGGSGGWIKIERESYSHSGSGKRDYGLKHPCRIGASEFDITFRDRVSKGLYEMRDGKLRIVYREDLGDRPAAFDAVANPDLTLLVLKKVKE